MAGEQLIASKLFSHRLAFVQTCDFIHVTRGATKVYHNNLIVFEIIDIILNQISWTVNHYIFKFEIIVNVSGIVYTLQNIQHLDA